MISTQTHKNAEIKIVPISDSKFPTAVLINYKTWVYDNQNSKGLFFAENVKEHFSYMKKFIKANKDKILLNTPFNKDTAVFDFEMGDPFNNLKEKEKIKLSLDMSFEIMNNQIYPLQAKKIGYYTIVKHADTVIKNFNELNLFKDNELLKFKKRRK